MLNDILGKTTVRNRLQDFIDDEKLGASGYFPYLISIPHSPDKYYGGTIFMARAHLYKCLQHKYAVHDFINTSGNRFSDFTYQCEALLGCCIAEQGYSYRKGSMLRNFILKLLSHRVTYPLYEFYVNKCILKIRIECKKKHFVMKCFLVSLFIFFFQRNADNERIALAVDLQNDRPAFFAFVIKNIGEFLY